MKYYCRIDSSNNVEDTNLQLYSLRKAANEWNELADLVKKDGVDYLTERFTFIINCLGLSLSQLLGQNCPSPDKKEMEMPGKLLSSLLNCPSVDRLKRKGLNREFSDFLNYYSAIRHFGKVKDDMNYKSIDELTLVKLNHFRSMTIEIWDTVISMYRQDDENDIGEFSSISEIVYFEELTNMPSP
jgi:hypothetical protein